MAMVLGVDIGTTGMKLGAYRVEEGGLQLAGQFSQGYEINTYNNGQSSDIEPEKWQAAFTAGCRELAHLMGDVEAIGIAGTTPGMTAMDGSGTPLYPAILMLDQRSRAQAAEIIDTIGLDKILAESGNMPVAGGCSLASISGSAIMRRRFSGTPPVLATATPTWQSGLRESSPSTLRRPRSPRSTTL